MIYLYQSRALGGARILVERRMGAGCSGGDGDRGAGGRGGCGAGGSWSAAVCRRHVVVRSVPVLDVSQWQGLWSKSEAHRVWMGYGAPRANIMGRQRVATGRLPRSHRLGRAPEVQLPVTCSMLTGREPSRIHCRETFKYPLN